MYQIAKVMPLQKNHMNFTCAKTHVVTYTCDSAHEDSEMSCVKTCENHM